jgi:hypothetical protein
MQNHQTDLRVLHDVDPKSSIGRVEASSHLSLEATMTEDNV